MRFGSGTFSSERFKETSEALGYQYSDLSFNASANASAVDTETPLLEGRLGLQSLPCGVSLCSSDLRTLHDSAHEGTAERSLTIVFNLDGTASDTAFGAKGRLVLGSRGGAVVTLKDATRIASNVRAGQRSRSLMVRTRPEDFGDADVAGLIETALKNTSINMIPATDRMMHLARQLASSSLPGGVGQLLSESLSLDILAHSLLMLGQGGLETPHARMGGRDYAKLLTVRDMIDANPSSNFTLEELARDAGLSISTLKAKFPVAFGQPVFAYLRDVRMTMARDAIEKEGWTVSEAAYFVGYKHPSNFTIAFRRKFGMAPSALRKSAP